MGSTWNPNQFGGNGSIWISNQFSKIDMGFTWNPFCMNSENDIYVAKVLDVHKYSCSLLNFTMNHIILFPTLDKIHTNNLLLLCWVYPY
jgi:hypothetical protein